MNSKYSGQQVEAILDKANAGTSAKIVQLPDEVFNLVGTTSEDSAAILQAFGGKDAMIKLVQQIIDADIVCIKPSESTSGYLNSLVVSVKFTDNYNLKVILLFIFHSSCVTFTTFSFALNAGSAAVMSINSSSIPDELAGNILTKDDIVNNLSSTSTQVPLSAAQGKVLNEKIESISGGGSSNGVFKLGLGIMSLNERSTHQEIQAAFNNKYYDFYEAIETGMPIIISNDVNTFMTCNMPVSALIIDANDTISVLLSYMNISYKPIGFMLLCIRIERESKTLSVTSHTRENIGNK